MEAGEWEVVMTYVEMGFGVSVLPEIMIQPRLRKRLFLRELSEIEEGAGFSRYGVLLKKGKHVSPAARELIKMLAPHFDFGALNQAKSSTDPS